MTFVNNTPDDCEASTMMTGNSNILKIPTFDGTGLRELQQKQFVTTAAHGGWTFAEETVAQTMHLQVLAASL